MALSRTYRPAALATAFVLGAGLFVGSSRDARADNVSPTGKGIAGGALLGGEVVTITEAIIGVRAGWAYLVGGLAGAAAGGIGGYFVEQSTSNGQVPMYMLAGGLALVIPAVVLSLDATRYRPEEGATEDRTPAGPPAEPGVPGASISSPSSGPAPAATPAAAPSSAPAATPSPSPGSTPAPPPPPTPQSFLDLHGGNLRLGVPLPSITPSFTPQEQKTYGLVKNEAEFRMPVLHVTF
jgi:hypothetical protein